MKNIQKLFPLILIWIVQTTCAQDNSQKDQLIKKVETYLQNISSESEIDRYKVICQRKIIIKGSFDNNGKIFRQVIKYYKSGLKEEHTKIYGKSLGFKFLLADIIRINDRIFFAKAVQMEFKGKQKYTQLYEETILDHRIYNKTDL